MSQETAALIDCKATYGLFKIGGILVSSNRLLGFVRVILGPSRTQGSLESGAAEPWLQLPASHSSFGSPHI